MILFWGAQEVYGDCVEKWGMEYMYFVLWICSKH
jgi:hypothetical protein